MTEALLARDIRRECIFLLSFAHVRNLPIFALCF
jgi:hypothetical protein